MKYHCGNCGSVFEEGVRVFQKDYPKHCMYCLSDMSLIPDYETPAQYQKRTGEPWPDNGPVWAISDEEYPQWHIVSYAEAKEMDKVNDTWFACAHGPKVPDDDWTPEGL